MRRFLAVTAVFAILATAAAPREVYAQPSPEPAITAPSPGAPAVTLPSGFSFDASNMLGELILAVVVASVGVVLKRLNMTKERRDLILTLGNLGYGVVSELARKTQTKIDDKAAEALKWVLEQLQAHGQPPLAPEESAQLRALFDGMHAREKMLAASIRSPAVAPVPQMPPAQ